MEKISDLVEENFCLKFELDTLAEVLLRSQSERWVPGYLHQSTEHSHIERYKLACSYAKDKKVVDIACGVGRGSFLLAEVGQAAKVDGYDIDAEAIRYAKWRNKHDNTAFAIINAEEFDASNKYDLAISFETIEHLNNFEDFVFNIKRSLKEGGLFIVSTPISSMPIDNHPWNKYHVREWGFLQFQEVLNKSFTIEKVYVQLYPMIEQELKYPSISQRVVNKLKRTFLSSDVNSQPLKQVIKQPALSVIEEFVGQYNIEELGGSRIGYEIIVARKV